MASQIVRALVYLGPVIYHLTNVRGWNTTIQCFSMREKGGLKVAVPSADKQELIPKLSHCLGRTC